MSVFTLKQMQDAAEYGWQHPSWGLVSVKTGIAERYMVQVRHAAMQGDGNGVRFTRYRAIGFDTKTNCAEMVADPEGAWVHVMDIDTAMGERHG